MEGCQDRNRSLPQSALSLPGEYCGQPLHFCDASVVAPESGSAQTGIISVSGNGTYGRGKTIFPEQFQCELAERVESEELVFDFAISTELDFPHFVGQKW